ncbi:MAG TPA: proton-conducting transporter membrane subunit [Kofleriaceae bacterium]|nr:proton-conducting transporter membrane subunit [Kofleriaceae bacterium]
MIAIALLLAPIVALLALAVRPLRAHAAVVLVAMATVTTALAFAVAIAPSQGTLLAGHLRADPTSRLFLAVIDPIFLGISVYVAYRVATTPRLRAGIDRIVALAALFLAACNAVVLANHLLVMWILLEASTFAAAPLVVRAAVPSSRLASWRYFLFSTVGLGLVLLGYVCIARGSEGGGHEVTFFVDQLLAATTGGADPWTQLGIALVILGLGTKLGLAPMYSWLPETYDQAPPAITAMLAAVQFNCALVVLLRVVQIFRPQAPALVLGELVTLGLLSMAISTVSLIATRNVTRLIAYASINHAGAIAIGLGIGKDASYGMLLYAVSNAFIKVILFLTAGKIEAHYRTKDTRQIAGLLKGLPYSGVFLMVGTFALLGFPPFGSFFGELLILSALVSSGKLMVFAAFCVLVSVSFVATGRTIFPMIWGEPKQVHDWPRQTFLSTAPKVAFLIVLLVLGVYIPSIVNELIQHVAVSVEGR